LRRWTKAVIDRVKNLRTEPLKSPDKVMEP
jgi:hypothetical protein